MPQIINKFFDINKQIYISDYVSSNLLYLLVKLGNAYFGEVAQSIGVTHSVKVASSSYT